MGKITGFLEYQRENVPHRGPEERIGDFLEFKQLLSHQQRREQAARCQAAFSRGGNAALIPFNNMDISKIHACREER